jgi:cell fate regulator YaaT (PSP1 superfamily)
MCCLRYEHETYEAEIAKTPKIDATVKTPDGIGTVTETSPLTGFIKVKIGDSIKAFHRDSVTVIKKNENEQKK